MDVSAIQNVSVADRRLRERTDVAVVLLLLQATLGLLSLLGLIVVAFLFPVVSPAGVMVLIGFLLPLVCAIGLARGWRWARRAAFVYQVVALGSVCINLLIDLIPQVQMELTLSGLATGVVLPVGLIALLRTPAVERVPERQALPAFPAPAVVPDGGPRRPVAEGVA
jgi:hypothetical protein